MRPPVEERNPRAKYFLSEGYLVGAIASGLLLSTDWPWLYAVFLFIVAVAWFRAMWTSL